MFKHLTIIFSPNLESLQKFKDKATHWLPENAFNPTNDIYQPGNVICTTKATTLDLLKVLMQDNTLSHKDVIWIDVTNPDCMLCYTFAPEGNFNNFFKL